MSFWDKVKQYTQPYADEEYDDYDEEEVESYEDEAPRGGRRARPEFGSVEPAQEYAAPAYAAPAPEQRNAGFNGTVLNMSSGKQEVVLFHARAFDDAAKAADELVKRRAVILNMENVDKAMTRRVVDFLSGCVYALNGKVKKVAQATYLFCPHNMDIVGDLESLQAEATESYI